MFRQVKYTQNVSYKVWRYDVKFGNHFEAFLITKNQSGAANVIQLNKKKALSSRIFSGDVITNDALKL